MASRKEYEMLFALEAQLGREFRSTFAKARGELGDTADSAESFGSRATQAVDAVSSVLAAAGISALLKEIKQGFDECRAGNAQIDLQGGLSMAYIEAERFAALKARVKAECLRRCHTGSVAEYGGEEYEYTNNPTEDHTVDVEHYEKLALPLSKIHSEKVPSLDGHRIVFDEDITEFEAALTLFETRPMTDKTRGDCEASCTGACYTGCSGDCTGGCETTCSGECQGSCTGCGSGCANTCTGTCTGECYGCGGNCSGGCSGSCDGSCSGCSGGCSGGCSSSCSGGCKSSCTVTCGNTGCVGSCLGLCSAGCTTSCQTSCGYCGTNCTSVSK